MEPAVEAFLSRGQNDELLSTLTGRTLAWARVHTFPRTGFQELFGIGYGDKSIDGLPIDNGYLATYHEAGKIGLVIVCTAIAVILLRAFCVPEGRQPGAVHLPADVRRRGLVHRDGDRRHVGLRHAHPAGRDPPDAAHPRPVGRALPPDQTWSPYVRILLVHNRYRSAEPSGENHVVESEARELRQRGHDVRVWGPSSDRDRRAVAPPEAAPASPRRLVTGLGAALAGALDRAPARCRPSPQHLPADQRLDPSRAARARHPDGGDGPQLPPDLRRRSPVPGRARVPRLPALVALAGRAARLLSGVEDRDHARRSRQRRPRRPLEGARRHPHPLERTTRPLHRGRI